MILLLHGCLCDLCSRYIQSAAALGKLAGFFPLKILLEFTTLFYVFARHRTV